MKRKAIASLVLGLVLTTSPARAGGDADDLKGRDIGSTIEGSGKVPDTDDRCLVAANVAGVRICI